MATPAKPAIVLVHGIWHSPLTYTKLTTALQYAGFDVYTPFLPSCSGFSPLAVHAAEDVHLVRRLVEMLAEQGRSIIMLLHSYGGIVGCDAIQGLDARSRSTAGKKGGVTHIVGLAAHLHPEGFAILDIVREFGDEHLIPLAFNITDDGSCMSGDPIALLFGELPKDEADALVLTLSRAPYDLMEHKAQYQAWLDIPVTYVHTTKDITLPPHYQQRILEKLKKAGSCLQTVALETGHSMHATQPAEIVKIVQDIASKTV